MDASEQSHLAKQLDCLASLQEELIGVLTSLNELKKEGEELQNGMVVYDQLAADLRERKKKHNVLKVRCKELKQARRQHQATEQNLRELLEI